MVGAFANEESSVFEFESHNGSFSVPSPRRFWLSLRVMARAALAYWEHVVGTPFALH
jgi:hypothetical protein